MFSLKRKEWQLHHPETLIGAALIGCALLLTSVVAAGDAEDVDMASRLAELLRAGRSVVSNYQTLINDPTIGDKEIDSTRFVKEAVALYSERMAQEPFSGDLTERDRRLVQAQLDAMREVLDEHQDDINREGIGFKGFVPAIFARLINEKFSAKVGQEARVRVTAPEQLVRNRKSLPDPWERQIIQDVFSDPKRARGRRTWRSRKSMDARLSGCCCPNITRDSCLTCHGEPKGEIDVTGYPKEGGKAGDLGGAISIVLFK